jgi:purine nucleosidase
MSEDRRVRVWVDTDVGTNPDDGVALLVALAHPELEVVGVSTVSGDTRIRAAVARVYLGDRAVSVVAGAGRPRGGGPAPRWMGYEGDGPLEGTTGAVTESEEQLVDEVRSAEPDTLVAIGPLTNVARLIEADAAPGEIVAMAGVTTRVWHRGELHDTDHNTASDPAAAVLVRRRARHLVTVPLDVTVAMRLTDHQAGVVAARHPRLAHEVSHWLRHAGPVVLHDPLAVLAAVPSERARIGLEIDGDGRTTARATRVDGTRAVARVLDLLAQEPR